MNSTLSHQTADAAHLLGTLQADAIRVAQTGDLEHVLAGDALHHIVQAHDHLVAALTMLHEAEAVQASSPTASVR